MSPGVVGWVAKEGGDQAKGRGRSPDMGWWERREGTTPGVPAELNDGAWSREATSQLGGRFWGVLGVVGDGGVSNSTSNPKLKRPNWNQLPLGSTDQRPPL